MMQMIVIEFINEQPLPLPEKIYQQIEKCFETALADEGFDDIAEVNLTFAEDEYVRKINREFREIDAVTDVLSFPLGDENGYDVNPETNRIMLGDIVIAVERASRQAQEYSHSLERELCFLAVHSLFHLLGYDHEVGLAEESEMFSKQESVLQKMNILR